MINLSSILKESKIKIILLGANRVGKTSIALRYTKNSFPMKYKPSLGVDFLVKRIKYNNKNIKILVFDTGAQELITELRTRFYHGASGAIVVYDITNRDTFNRLDKLINEIKEELDDVYIAIVGNKLDLNDDRVVTSEEANKYAISKGAVYFEVSALTGQDVDKLFSYFLEQIIK